MIDCYRILDVPYSAAPAEIRVAYLAKMKALHPDLCPDDAGSPIGASDVTFAYWHLRDPDRRAEHDRALFEFRPRPRLRSRRQQPCSRRRVTTSKRPQQRVHRRNSARLKRLRTAAGFAAFAVAGGVAIISFTYLPAREGPRSPSLAAAVAAGGGGGGEARAARKQRRKIDAALASAAAHEFGSVVRRSGGAGAHRYLRQCLAQLATAPSLTILDYCIAFENKAAMWEHATLGEERYFAGQQRIARYRSLAQSIRGGTTRDALMEEVEYLAGAGS